MAADPLAAVDQRQHPDHQVRLPGYQLGSPCRTTGQHRLHRVIHRVRAGGQQLRRQARQMLTDEIAAQAQAGDRHSARSGWRTSRLPLDRGG